MAYHQTTHRISPGQTWQSDKGDTLFCGDSSTQYFHADMIYTDPAWNDAILKKFYILAGITTGKNFQDMSLSVCDTIQRADPRVVFIEMGLPGTPFYVQEMRARGFFLQGSVDCLYNSGKGIYKLLLFGQEERTIILLPSATMREAQLRISEFLITHRELHSFFDPCAGEGFFIAPALKLGITSFGCEMIPDKFASMLGKLTKIAPFHQIGERNGKI